MLKIIGAGAILGPARVHILSALVLFLVLAYVPAPGARKEKLRPAGTDAPSLALLLAVAAVYLLASVDPASTSALYERTAGIFASGAAFPGGAKVLGAAPSDYGMSTLGDQPEGAPVAAALLLSFLGRAAATALFLLLPAVLGFVLVREALLRAGSPKLAAPLLAAILFVNPLVLKSGFVTHFALPFLLFLSSFLVFLMSSEDFSGRSLLAGGILAALLSSRHELLVCAPAVLLALGLWRTPWSRPALFLAGFLVLIFPSLYFHWTVLGSPLAHETQVVAPAEGFYLQCLGPACFRFNGLLNFQGGTIVRTPGYPYPVFLYLPLLFLSSFGLLASALALLGASAAPRAAAPWILWLAFSFLLFAPMENWDDNKLSAFLSSAAPFLLLCAAGLRELKGRPAALLAIIAALALLQLLAGALEFPLDARWSLRMAGVPGDPDAGAHVLRAALLAPRLLPRLPQFAGSAG